MSLGSIKKLNVNECECENVKNTLITYETFEPKIGKPVS